MNEPDAYLAQVYRFGLLEDFDHMYRYSALLDRLEGKDANNILQSYTDILPGRPTVEEHRAPQDDLRRPYDRTSAAPLSKLHALTIMAAEQQTHNYYMNIGPMFADPVARQLYAEIASIEEQHVTQYESIIDPEESWLEKWVMHELARGLQLPRLHAAGVQPAHQGDLGALPRLRARSPAHGVASCSRSTRRRDPEEILPESLPEPIPFASQREFVRETLAGEVDLRANGTEIVPKSKESKASLAYRKQMNADGSPSETVSAGYKWAPGSELKLKVA